MPSEPSQPLTTQPLSQEPASEDFQKLTDRVCQLESDLAKASEASKEAGHPTPTKTTAMIAGFATLGAALVVGALTLIGQYYTAERSIELARQEAFYNHAEKILEFRLKQLELFYAPMFARLEQSKGLYDKLLYQLAQDEPTRYDLRSTPDSKGYRLFVLAKDGKWKGFRLLDQLPAVRTNPKALALVERILEIGEQMTKIISEHAGLASDDVVDLLGEYLAHYAILSTIHKEGETEPYDPGWHKMGYYPRELNGKIEADYHELTQFLDEYGRTNKRMLEALPKRNVEEGL